MPAHASGRNGAVQLVATGLDGGKETRTMRGLQDRVAVVTGAANGIGAATARRLHQEGARVALLDIDHTNGTALAGHLDPGRALFVACDVTSQQQVAAAIDTTVGHFQGVDILVNNAGVNAYFDPETMTLAQWERFFALDLRACWLCSKHVLPHLRRQRRGVIVNVASIHARLTTKGMFPYAAAKSGIVGLIRSPRWRRRWRCILLVASLSRRRSPRWSPSSPRTRPASSPASPSPSTAASVPASADRRGDTRRRRSCRTRPWCCTTTPTTSGSPRSPDSLTNGSSREEPGTAAAVPDDQRVLVTLDRPLGWSRSRPRRRASSIATTWPGATATSGDSHSGTPAGSSRRSAAPASTAGSSATASTRAPRSRSAACTSRSCGRTAPLGATSRTGKPAPMAPIGPCSRSAPENGAASVPVSSVTLRATSKAVAWLKPRATTAQAGASASNRAARPAARELSAIARSREAGTRRSDSTRAGSPSRPAESRASAPRELT